MRVFLLVIVSVALAVGLGFFFSGKLAIQTQHQTPPTPYELPKKITRLYQQPRPLSKTTAISPVCEALWKQISALDMTLKFTPPPASNCKDLPPPLDRFHALYSQSCATKDDNCFSALYQYRAAITHFTTLGMDLGSIRDMRILVDKLMATFERDPKLAAAIADRIVELEPDNYPAHKAGLIASLISDPQADGMQRRLDNLRRLETGDAAAQDELEIFLGVMKDNDPEATFERASDLNDTNPKSAVGPYFMAWAASKRGNRDESLAHVKECIKRDPKNPRYQKTYQALQQNTQNAFTFYISFPLAPQ